MALKILYLLADPGISLSDSSKGASIHARSMINAMAHDFHTVTALCMRYRPGQRCDLTTECEVLKPASGRLTRWFAARFITPCEAGRAPLDRQWGAWLLQCAAFPGLVAAGIALALWSLAAGVPGSPQGIAGLAAGVLLGGAAWPARGWLAAAARRRWAARTGGKPVRPGAAVLALYNLLSQRDLLRSALRLVREKGRPDLLYARDAWFAFPYHRLARLLGVPLVLEVNAIAWREKEINGEAAFTSLCRRIEKRNLAAADLILTVSEGVRRQAVEAGAEPGKVLLTPNGVDVEQFEELLDTPRLPVSENRFVVGMVCSVKSYHGVDLLVEAADQLKETIPDLLVWIIGAGPDLPKIRALVAARGLERVVRLEGIVQHHLLPGYMAQFDVAVAPFQGQLHNYMSPIKLFEYMASRRPIVCSRWGELPGLLAEDRDALFHTEGDAADLAAKVLQLHGDRALGHRLAASAFEVVRRNTWVEIFRRALGRLEEAGLLPPDSHLPDETDPDLLRRRDKLRHDRRARKREWRRIREELTHDMLWMEHDRQRAAFLAQYGAEKARGAEMNSVLSTLLPPPRAEKDADGPDGDSEAAGESESTGPTPFVDPEEAALAGVAESSDEPIDGEDAAAPPEDAYGAAEPEPEEEEEEEEEGEEEEDDGERPGAEAIPPVPDRVGLPAKPTRAVPSKPLKKRIARRPWERRLYNLAARCLTWYADRLERRRTPSASPPVRPIRVFRLIASASVGGVAKVMNQTILRLDPAQVETHVLLFGARDHLSPRLRTAAGIEFHHKPMQLWFDAWDWRIFTNIRRLKKLLVRSRADLVHVHEPQFAPAVRIAAALAGIPAVVQLHSQYSTRRKSAHPVHRRLERLALLRLPLIGHAQNVIEDAYQYIGWGASPANKRIYLALCGVDDQPLWAQEDNVHRWIVEQASGRKIYLLIARLIKLKRVPDFMTACRMLMDSDPEVFMVLVVYGKDRVRELRDVSRRFYQTFVPGEAELFNALASPADLLPHVHAAVSCSELEGLPKSLLEYMQHDVPVVCSDIPAHRQLVEHEETGLLFEVGNLPAMLHAMRRVLRDEGLRGKLTSNARATLAERRWASTAEQNTRIYRSILTQQA